MFRTLPHTLFARRRPTLCLLVTMSLASFATAACAPTDDHEPAASDFAAATETRGVRDVAMTDEGACLVDTVGDVTCLGHDGAFAYSIRKSRGITGASSVALGAVGVNGEHRGCAVLDGGGVACWGVDRAGASRAFASTASPVAGITDATQVAVASARWTADGGLGFACARTARGTVMCWGLDYEQLTHDGDRAPREVPGLADVTALAAGHRFVCALTASGDVLCWGRNIDGVLDPSVGVSTMFATPQKVAGGVVALDARETRLCMAHGPGGVVTCQGARTDGGVRTSMRWNLDGSGDATGVFVGQEDICVSDAAVGMRCSGSGVSLPKSRATPLPAGAKVVLALGSGCALAGNDLRCWSRSASSLYETGASPDPAPLLGFGEHPCGTLDSIVDHGVRITSAADLDALRAKRCVFGDVTFAAPGVDAIDLPNLVGAREVIFHAGSEALQTVHLAGLVHARHVWGTPGTSLAALTELRVDALTEIDSLVVPNAPKLTSLRVPSVKVIGTLGVTAPLTQLDAPALERADGLVLKGTALRDVTGLPKLARLNGLTLDGNTELTRFTASFAVNDAVPLREGATCRGALRVLGNPKLTALSMPTSVPTCEVSLEKNPLLVDVALPALTTLQTLDVGYNASLASLAGLTSIDRVRVAVTITGNRALPQCAADAFASSVADATARRDLSSNDAAALCVAR